MTSIRHERLLRAIRKNARGDGFTPEDKTKIQRRDQSFKYIGALAYRPDIAGPERICFEIRDAHRDSYLLIEKICKVTLLLISKPEQFKKFAKTPPWNSEITFDELPQQIQKILIATFPYRGRMELSGFTLPTLVNETYRNFSFPFRRWESVLTFYGLNTQALEELRRTYLAKIEGSEKLDVQERKATIETALCDFFVESGIIDQYANLTESFKN